MRGAISDLRAASDYDAGTAVASAPRAPKEVLKWVSILVDKTAAQAISMTVRRMVALILNCGRRELNCTSADDLRDVAVDDVRDTVVTAGELAALEDDEDHRALRRRLRGG